MATTVAVMRLGLGARVGELDQVAADPRAWLHDQIVDQGADQPSGELLSTVDALQAIAEAGLASPVSPASTPAKAPLEKLRLRHAQDLKGAEIADGEFFARAQLASQTPAGFRERWALFWTNHFSLTSQSTEMEAILGAYEREAIRPHVFGRFEDLALAALKHPAMLMFYDQAGSAGPNSPARGGASENLGRESMELHTVGLGYSQADVHEMSMALTGWSIAGDTDPVSGSYLYRTQNHEPGARTVLGQVYPDTGESQADAIVRGLGRRPETARHIAMKIARHFVSDPPPASLVDRLSQSYQSSGGSLAALAHALVDAPETWEPAAGRFKSPMDLYVSANRALGRGPGSPGEPRDVLGALQQPLFGAPTPAGWPDTDATWTSPSGLANRLAWLRTVDGGDVTDGQLAQVARNALGPRLRSQTLPAISQTAWTEHRVALLLMSPEFQRR